VGINEPELIEAKMISFFGHACIPMSPIVFFLIGFLSVGTHVTGQYTTAKAIDYIIPGEINILALFVGLVFCICGLIIGFWAYKEQCRVACAEGFVTSGVIFLMFFQVLTAVGV
jgi:hypothetical protein